MQKKRGRTSVAELTVAKTATIQVMDRPKPPHDLSDEEVEVWAAVTSSQAADWFDPSNLPLLTQYCRHVIRARHLGEWIERASSSPDLAIEDYDRLLKMQQRESGAIAMLATKMRISQQSTTNHRGNKKPSQARKPWEG
jgi:hypothetical protein